MPAKISDISTFIKDMRSPIKPTFLAGLSLTALTGLTQAELTDWQTAYDHWADEQLADVDEAARQPSANADGDRLTNFQEFSLATDPSEPTVASAFQNFQVIDLGNELGVEMTYQRRSDGVAMGLRYEIEISRDLETWQPAEFARNFTEKRQISDSGESERITTRLRVLPGADQLYLRMEIAPPGIAAVEATWPELVFLADLADGENGMIIRGQRREDLLGASVAPAGDVNGDGVSDLIVGATGAGDQFNENASGQAYVIFGGNALPGVLDVENLDGTNGFSILGGEKEDRLGTVSSGGDINDDGIDDLLVGAHLANLPLTNAGAGYVIFGSDVGFPALLDVRTLDGTNGFALRGTRRNDRTGISLANVGDLNGDGISDVAIGADTADADKDYVGKVHVVYGNAGGFPAEISAGDLDGTNGFTMIGTKLQEFAGRDVAGVGDINGDGLSDMIVGTSDRQQTELLETEQDYYVVFGNAEGFPDRFRLRNIDGTNGFRIRLKITSNRYAGGKVAGAGDINGDGLADIVIGNEEGVRNPRAAGSVYIIFGNAKEGFPEILHSDMLDGTNGTVIHGDLTQDNMGSDVDLVGDVDGDGTDDLLVGARRVDGATDADDDFDTGAAYLIFGRENFLAEHFIVDLLNGGTATRLIGERREDQAGRSVSRAGDVNDDGAPDFIIGAHRRNRDVNNNGTDDRANTGAAYILYGRTGGGE